ncbi:nitrogenase component 1, partial [Methanoregula sp.]|uniref:nitrogenase component 1 n=1 Tax=Methanoregula sp. TaxID=2052170 RepID=UPI0025F7A24B
MRKEETMEDLCTLPAAGVPVVLNERERSIMTAGKSKTAIHCADDSLAGSVSQRACVFCGARVVLNPVTDAAHLVHGPIGCAAVTGGSRGTRADGPRRYGNTSPTDNNT